MLRKTVAIAGLILIVGSLLFVSSDSPGMQAAVFASGLFTANAYLPIISKEGAPVPPPIHDPNCSPCYPDVCIPPPDLDCGQIPYCRFRVVSCDPHGLDGDGDGIGCERCSSEMNWVRQPALAD